MKKRVLSTSLRLQRVLVLINEQLWIGHFEMWAADGTLLFRHATLLDSDDEHEDIDLTLGQAFAKAVEIVEKKSANEIMEMEIKKLEEEKKQQEKKRIANLLSNSDEEDEDEL